MNDQEKTKEELICELEELRKGNLKFRHALKNDITERKKTEAIFNQFMEYSPIFVFFKDENMRSLRLSRNYEQILGKPLDELLGKTMHELFPSELAKTMIENDLKIFREGMKVEIEEEFNNHYYSTIKFPIQVEGKPKFLAGFTRDITERKQADEAILKSKQQFDNLVAQIPVGVYILRTQTDYTSTLEYGSPKMAEMLDLSIESLISNANIIFEAIHPDDLDGFVRLHQEGIQHKRNFDWKGRALVKGCIKWLHLRSRPQELENGDILWHGLIVDITEQIQAEVIIKQKNKELAKLNAEKDKFFSIIAHDLRSPFSGFLGLTQVMAEELPSLTLAQIQEFVIMMSKSASNLYRLLENLLQWSQFQQGAIPFNPEVIQLRRIVVESIEMILDPAKIKGIEIETDIAEEMEVFAVNNMFQSIIRNLVSNAIKFTPKGGKVKVSARLQDNMNFEISIHDSGIGMSREMVDNLFHLDAQTNRKGTEGEPSTGLGLILCKEFVEKLGGKIWVESEEGIGSAFYFTLPCNAEPEEKSVDSDCVEDDATKKDVKNLKILIAEDDETSEKIITIHLGKLGGEILIARNGLEAVEVCRNNPDTNLILMDIQMPELNGYDATREIRQFNKDVIIIAHTAFGRPDDRQNAVAAGCDDYLPKPFNKAELLSLIQKYLEN